MELTQLLKLELLRSVGAGAIAASLIACGGAVTPQLADARTAYNQAESGPASTRAPGLLAEARVALDRAERAHDDQPGSQREASLAESAERKARHAQAHAEGREERDRDRVAVTTDGDVAPVASTAAERERDERAALEKQRVVKDSPRERREATSALQSLAKVASVKEHSDGVVITMSGGLLFPAGDKQISPIARDNLDQVAHALKEQPSNTTFKVVGYTDSSGPDAENQQLSAKRAQAVADRLTQSGIAASRISAVGRGEADPIADNETAEGRATNRRVEIVVERHD
ncbi:MAG: hypothetical protein RL701_5392 [Pseudomonadota bacterium]|jgi:outer membrane protein OmpA-like peptidoglycan-associated protein